MDDWFFFSLSVKHLLENRCCWKVHHNYIHCDEAELWQNNNIMETLRIRYIFILILRNIMILTGQYWTTTVFMYQQTFHLHKWSNNHENYFFPISIISVYDHSFFGISVIQHPHTHTHNRNRTCINISTLLGSLPAIIETKGGAKSNKGDDI